MRRNLMGHRINHSYRSFITGNPSIKISELGIPIRENFFAVYKKKKYIGTIYPDKGGKSRIFGQIN